MAAANRTGLLPEPEAQHVGHRVFARVAEQFGHQQQCHQPGDQEADGVEEAVVAVDGDGTGDAEEAGRRQVVAGDRDAVLRAGEGVPAGEVLRRVGVAAADADHDEQRDDDERDEDADVDGRVSDLLAIGEDADPIHCSLQCISARIAAARGSSSRLANRM